MKKVLRTCAAFLCAALIAAAVFAAGGKDSGSGNGAVPTVKWVLIGNGMPDNYDAWIASVNTYLERKLGCRLAVEVISWGNWNTRRNVIINTNEPFDIIFTDENTFVKDVALGAYADLTPYLEQRRALTDFIPADYFRATTIKGKVYGIPTYKDSSATYYFVWDKAITDKYGVPYETLDTLEKIEPYAEKIRAGEGKPVRILANDAPTIFWYDPIGTGLTAMGVDIHDKTRTVVPVFEQADVMNHLRTLHRWYKKGLVNADAATLPEAPQYMPLKVAQGWPFAAVTTWGPQMGCEAVVCQYGETILSNSTVLGSVNAISASSKHIDKALAVLELANTDTRFRDMLYYGLEGTDFTYTDDKKVHKINNSWPIPGYCQASFFTVSQQDTETYNQWDEVRKLNEQAIPSAMLGFSMDITPVENQVINCKNIWMKYKQQLLTGAVDPDVYVPQMMKEMRNAGFDRIISEAQKQIKAYF
ncbi:ABC transporter substrate-binding protein [Treponema brennaborense]|uniref:Extracellular solute-binding protein family 1 n=1 Tax=Treponema brennaborense (strain DSM 12168 / CIP 105900 / DD5/3) TaxID=906968 RepID=F4LP37_TREBD|nr:ABC transporter substrate-binding protein [Treponema brennaborense]AEE15913.1 extracellular solute-binding protein family 1 [Treponema brennaborense DSM 12168]